MEIWANPACSKCRAATKALDETGVAYTVRRYLDEPPTAPSGCRRWSTIRD
jgi:arsenate reductase (glutaredoxin)